ncbi:MAG: PilZ domain-containing protein [Pseudomonadota bacterium]
MPPEAPAFDAAISGRARRSARHLTVLMVGKVRAGGHEFACVVNDVSRHGLKARFPTAPVVGEQLAISLRGLPELSATVRWSDGLRAGVEFDHPLDLAAILGVEVADRLPRAPRFVCDRSALLTLDGACRTIRLLDLSLGGAKLTAGALPTDPTGRWAALSVPGLAAPRAGTICWQEGDRAGFRFAMPLALDALATVLASQNTFQG